MKALILAAGLGTRLRPLTLARAKPALPILGIPTLWYPAWHIKRELQVSEFTINIGHLPESVISATKDQDLIQHTGIHFNYSDESSLILGSLGALGKIKHWIGKHTLAVANADTISFPSWKKMIEFHRDKSSVLTLHVRKFESSVEQYTDIKIDADGRVVALGEKATGGSMFSGCYLFDPSLIERIPSGVSELRPTLLEPLIKEGRLFAFQEEIPWIDTGTVAGYAMAQFSVLKTMPKCRELVEVKMREIAPQVWISRKVRPDSVALEFQSPVILCGEPKEWAKHAGAYGPHFIGIEPPKKKILKGTLPNSNAIVLADTVQVL